MNIVLGIVFGLVWGLLAAFINYRIMKKAIAKNTNNAMMACNAKRMAVDFVCLASVLLLRNILPVNFAAAIVSAAAALSMTTIYFTFRLMKEQ